MEFALLAEAVHVRSCHIAAQFPREAHPRLQKALHCHRCQLHVYPGFFQISQEVVVRDLPQRIFQARTVGEFPFPPLPYVIQVQIPEYERQPFGLGKHPLSQCIEYPLTPSQWHAEQRYPEVTRLTHDVVDGHLLVGDGTALGVERRQEDEVKGRR